jgi:hypothetical protein
VVLFIGASSAFASLTLTGTSIGGDGSFTFDAPGTLSIGTTSATRIILGNSGNSLNVSSTAVFSGGLTAALADKGGQVFNVLAYGAKGDGSTDDSTAIATAITAATTRGGTVYFPPGTYILGTAAQISLPTGVVLQGAGRNNTALKASPTMPLSQNMIQTANWNTANCQPGTTGGSYSNCPYAFGVVDLTLDGNAVARGGAGTGDVLAIRGVRYLIRNVEELNGPNDGIYSEAPGGLNTAPYNGFNSTINYNSGSTIVFGNLAVWENVRMSYNYGWGMKYFGPPDSQMEGVVPFWNGIPGGTANGNGGAWFACLPGSNGGVCGADVYVNKLHAFHNGGWGWLINTPTRANEPQSENSWGQGGASVDVLAYTPMSATVAGTGITTVTFSTGSSFSNVYVGTQLQISGFSGIANQTVTVATVTQSAIGAPVTAFTATLGSTYNGSTAGTVSGFAQGNDYGVLQANSPQFWYNLSSTCGATCPGLYINSPPASYTWMGGNEISNLQSFQNAVGLVVTANATHTNLSGVVRNSSVQGVKWAAADSKLDITSTDNTGNGLDLSAASPLSFSQISGVVKNNSGTQVIWPSSSTQSTHNLAVYTSTGQTDFSGTIPLGLSGCTTYSGQTVGTLCASPQFGVGSVMTRGVRLTANQTIPSDAAGHTVNDLVLAFPSTTSPVTYGFECSLLWNQGGGTFSPVQFSFTTDNALQEFSLNDSMVVVSGSVSYSPAVTNFLSLRYLTPATLGGAYYPMTWANGGSLGGAPVNATSITPLANFQEPIFEKGTLTTLANTPANLSIQVSAATATGNVHVFSGSECHQWQESN